MGTELNVRFLVFHQNGQKENSHVSPSDFTLKQKNLKAGHNLTVILWGGEKEFKDSLNRQ